MLQTRLFYPELQDHTSYYSSADCAGAVARVKQYLVKMGVSKGGYTAVVLPNNLLTLILYLTLLEIGSIAVSFNVRWSDQEIQDQLDKLNCQIVISDRVGLGVNRVLITGVELGTYLANQADPIQLITNYIDLPSTEQIQGIFFTSGTTGKPKGVQLTVGNHYHSALTVNHFLQLNLQLSSPHWLLTLPLYHVGGMGILWRVLVGGGKISLAPKFTEETIIDWVRTGDVHLISLVPTMWKKILPHELFVDALSHWQKLKAIFLGGERADRSLLEKCLHYQLPIFVTYGMTECASQISILDVRKYPHKLNSVGQVLDHIQLEINAPEPATGIGEIAIHSPSLTCGYYRDELKFNQNGYYLTGDMGYVSENFLYLVDRRTDLIISGGENIYPAELEQILIKHPQIQEVVVIPQSDATWGQVPAVIYTGEANLTLSDIQTFCLNAHLARYKLPKYLYWVQEMPLNSNHKIDRRLLRKLANQKQFF